MYFFQIICVVKSILYFFVFVLSLKHPSLGQILNGQIKFLCVSKLFIHSHKRLYHQDVTVASGVSINLSSFLYSFLGPCKHSLRIFLNTSVVKSTVLGSLGRAKMSECPSSSLVSPELGKVIHWRSSIFQNQGESEKKNPKPFSVNQLHFSECLSLIMQSCRFQKRLYH